jgi:hypothetical protein
MHRQVRGEGNCCEMVYYTPIGGPYLTYEWRSGKKNKWERGRRKRKGCGGEGDSWLCSIIFVLKRFTDMFRKTKFFTVLISIFIFVIVFGIVFIYLL